MSRGKFLSEKEFQIIQDSDFLLAKSIVIEKIQNQFSKVRDELRGVIEESGFVFPDEVDVVEGKSFRGENYRRLPYVVLDYPKYYSKESIFAVRTMFWWGNFFSITLHLQGSALESFRKVIIERWYGLLNNDIFICTNQTPWEYHYENDNYKLADHLQKDELLTILNKGNFIKLSRKIGMKNYESLFPVFKESLKLFLALMKRVE